MRRLIIALALVVSLAVPVVAQANYTVRVDPEADWGGQHRFYAGLVVSATPKTCGAGGSSAVRLSTPGAKTIVVRGIDPCGLNPVAVPFVWLMKTRSVSDSRYDNTQYEGRYRISSLVITVRIGNQVWRYRASYDRFLGREIQDEADFDDYINICIDQSVHIYARDGHLWCYVPPVTDITLKLVRA